MFIEQKVEHIIYINVQNTNIFTKLSIQYLTKTSQQSMKPCHLNSDEVPGTSWLFSSLKASTVTGPLPI